VIYGLRDVIKLPENEILGKIIQLIANIKSLEKENGELKSKLLTLDIQSYFENERKLGEHVLYVHRVDVENMDQLKALGDKVREKMISGIAVFGAVIDETPQVLCVVTDDLVKEGVKAGNIVRSLGKALGGGGGGKPHMASAGGKDAEKLDEVLENIETLV
jgi:alanyl-tRNA synthetase